MGIPIYDIFIVLFNNLDGWSVVLTDSQNEDVDLWCGHSLTQFRYSVLVFNMDGVASELPAMQSSLLVHSGFLLLQCDVFSFLFI